MAFIGRNPKWNTATHTPQSSDPTNPVEGMLFYSDGTSRAEGLWTYRNLNWVFVEGGAADADTIDLTRADDLADATTSNIDLQGNNADFDGGGSITGSSLTLSTTAADLLTGETQVIKYDPNADGSDDYFGFTRSVQQSWRGRDLGFKFEYKNDSTTVDNDFRFCVKIKDGANAGLLTYSNLPAYNSSNTGKTFSAAVYIPNDCTEVEYGFQNQSTTTTVELMVDNMLVTANPYIYKNIYDENHFSDWIQNNGTASIISQSSDDNPAVASVNRTGTGIVDVTFTAGFFAVAPAVNVAVAHTINSSVWAMAYNVSTTGCTVRVIDNGGSSNDRDFVISTTKQGSDYGFNTENVVHAKSGTENQFNARIANNGTASITSQSSPDNPAIASVSRTSTGNVDVVYTSGFFSVIPSISLTPYNERSAWFITPTINGFTARTYSTGFVDTDFDIELKRQGTDYKNPNAYAITPLSRIAHIRAHATNFSASNSATTSYKAATLSSVSGDAVVSVSSNQAKFAAGKYNITVPVGASDSCNWVDVKLYDAVNLSDIAEELDVVYSGSTSVSFTSVTFSVEFDSETTVEFQTKASAAVGSEYVGKIKVEKVL